MNIASIAKTAALATPLLLAAIAAAATITTQYDPQRDQLTITIRKISPIATALQPLRRSA